MYYFLKLFLLGPILKLLFQPKIDGLDNFPKRGAVIVAANHLSFFDSFFLGLALSRRIHFMAKSDYFYTKGIFGKLTKMFFKSIGQIPMYRDHLRLGKVSINMGTKILQEGGVLGIYPEGSRSPDGKLYKGYTGISNLILENNPIVVPIGILSAYSKYYSGERLRRITQIVIKIGEPIDFSYYSKISTDNVYIKRSIVDTILLKIQNITRQQYIDAYSRDVKKRIFKIES